MSSAPGYDVVILGGGPAGSTLGSILMKHRPQSRVLIVEREVFPREHVGESQLPPITRILHEMGVWEKVEAAGFPVKTGAFYRWGSSPDLWRFDFLVGEEYVDRPRPGPLEGQRWDTTFHVERAIFDEILLDHAASLGCEVREGVKASEVRRDGDKVEALRLTSPHGDEWVTADWFIDATGNAGFLRRGLGVEVEEPTALKNIAIWNYWTKDDWKNVEGVGKGGARVRVLSLGYGWIWFIPISPTRTSIGFITHQDYYLRSGLKPEELYAKALSEEPHLTELLKGAESEPKVKATKDWSFLSRRMKGDNWMLVGECAGFADPILAGGMTLAMVGAREAAYVLKGILDQEHDPEWLLDWYESSQKKRIGQHIQFADYWYSANAHFSELKEHTTRIAAQAGLDLNPNEAFRWLAAGGFANDDITGAKAGTYTLGAAKIAMEIMTGIPSEWTINKHNIFSLNLEGAEKVAIPYCHDGQIEKVKAWRREGRLLPLVGIYRLLFKALTRASDADELVAVLRSATGEGPAAQAEMLGALDALEALATEGWVTCGVNRHKPFLNVYFDKPSVSMAGQA